MRSIESSPALSDFLQGQRSRGCVVRIGVETAVYQQKKFPETVYLQMRLLLARRIVAQLSIEGLFQGFEGNSRIVCPSVTQFMDPAKAVRFALDVKD
jgi:hypothetical protein